MGRSSIGWTDETWNPVTGCSRVSPGCQNCYAETLSLRYGWSKKPWTNQNAAENVVLHPKRLDQPLRWRKPRMVFVNSMSDVFHEQITTMFLDKMFAVMALSQIHTFQVLTKRQVAMAAYLVMGQFELEAPKLWGAFVVDSHRPMGRLGGWNYYLDGNKVKRHPGPGLLSHSALHGGLFKYWTLSKSCLLRWTGLEKKGPR